MRHMTGCPDTAADAGPRDAAAVSPLTPRTGTHAGPGPRAEAGLSLSILVTSVASDSHTWNLVFLQLGLEELGHRVINLGACVPDDLLVTECLRSRPDLVVISSVNGHGFIDGMRLIGRLRACDELASMLIIIGGKLGIAGPSGRRNRDQLLAAGFDAVFEETEGIAALRAFAERLMSVST